MPIGTDTFPATRKLALGSIERKVDHFSAYLLLLLVTLGALIVSFGIYVRAEKQIDVANESREESLRVSDLLRQSSLDLTSMARAYVVTGDEDYRDHYLRILAIRDGREPRPTEYRGTFWELYERGSEALPSGESATPLLDLARAAGFTAEELRVLGEAKAKSDALARVEIQAMHTVATSPRDSASRAAAVGTLYDDAYRDARGAILRPITAAEKMVDRRTREQVGTAAKRAYQIRILVIVIGLVQIFLLWRTRRQLYEILGGTVRDVYQTIARLGEGDFSPSSSTVRGGDNVLGWVAESRARLASLELGHFKAIVESSDDAIISNTPEGIITSWNAGAERIFGFTAAEAIGHWVDLLIPEERAAQEVRIRAQLSRGDQIASFETRRRCKDGRVIDVAATISPIIDEHGRVIGSSQIARDITVMKQLAAELVRHRDHLERKVAERTAELQVAMGAAEDASRAKSAFLATTSHELRTPLNAIIGFSSLLLEGMMGDLTAEQRKALAVVHRSGEELLALVTDILDLSAIEAGNLHVDPEPVQLQVLLEKLCEAFHIQAEERGLEMRPVVCDSSIVVWADAARLAQVVRNLVGNAIKFSDHGFVQVRASRQEDASVLIEVQDSGIGIPVAEQHRLFQSFQRVVQPTGRLRAGTGLGLSICKRIVEAMGGDIGLDSDTGRGSRFWFSLPLARAGQTPVAETAPTAQV